MLISKPFLQYSQIIYALKCPMQIPKDWCTMRNQHLKNNRQHLFLGLKLHRTNLVLWGLRLPWNQAGVERQRKASNVDRSLPVHHHRKMLHQIGPVPRKAGQEVKVRIYKRCRCLRVVTAQIGNLSYTSLSELQRIEDGLQTRKLFVCWIV